MPCSAYSLTLLRLQHDQVNGAGSEILYPTTNKLDNGILSHDDSQINTWSWSLLGMLELKSIPCSLLDPVSTRPLSRVVSLIPMKC